MKQPKQATFMVLIDLWLGSDSISAMTPAEEGGYFRLCLKMAKAPECSLPDDDYELAQMSRLGRDWFKKPARSSMTSGERIRQRFRAEGGRLFHEQVDADRQRLAAAREQRSAAASSRWRREKGCETYAAASENECGRIDLASENDAKNMPSYGIRNTDSLPSVENLKPDTSGGGGGSGSVATASAEVAAAAAEIAEFAPNLPQPDAGDVAQIVEIVRSNAPGHDPIGALRSALAQLQRARKTPERSTAPFLVRTLPGAVRSVIAAQRAPGTRRAPSCELCGDTGVVLYGVEWSTRDTLTLEELDRFESRPCGCQRKAVGA